MDILVLDGPTKYICEKMQESGAKEWSRYLKRAFNPIGRGILYTLPMTQTGSLTVILYSSRITLECVDEDKGYLKVIKAYDTDILEYHQAMEYGNILEDTITFVPIHKFQYMHHKTYNDVAYFMRMRDYNETVSKEVEEEPLYNTLLKRLDNGSYENYQKQVETLNERYAMQQKAYNTLTLVEDILELLKETEEEKETVNQTVLELKEQKRAYTTALTAYHELPEEEHQMMQQLKESFKNESIAYEELIWAIVHEDTLDYKAYRGLILSYNRNIIFFKKKLEVYQKVVAEQEQIKEKIKLLEMELLAKRRMYLNREALKDFQNVFQDNINPKQIEKEIYLLEDELKNFYKIQYEKKDGIITTQYLDNLKEKLYALKEEVEQYVEMHRTVLEEALDTVTKGGVIDLFKRLETSYDFCQKNGINLQDLKDMEGYFELDAIAQKEIQIEKLIQEEQAKRETLSQKQEDLTKLLQVKLEEEDIQSYFSEIENSRLYVRQILNNLLNERSYEALQQLYTTIDSKAEELKLEQDALLSQDKIFKLKWAFIKELKQEVAQ